MNQVLALVLVAILFAGCVQSQPTKEPADDTPIPTGPSDATFPEIVLEDCIGGVLFAMVPAEWTRQFIPEGFQERLLVVDAVELSMRMRSCERGIYAGIVETNVQWLTTSIILFQEVDEASRRQTTLEVVSISSSETLATLLESIGLSTHVASFDRSISLPDNFLATHGWTINGADFVVEFEYANTELPQSVGVRKESSWIGGPPPIRMDHMSDEADAYIFDQDPIVVRLEGDSTLRTLLGDNPMWEFDQQARWNANYRYTFTGGFDQ